MDDGHCDWVHQFAVPLPLIVIGHQMGVKEEDIWFIKRATDAWVRRFGQMVSEEEEREALELESRPSTTSRRFRPAWGSRRHLLSTRNTESPELAGPPDGELSRR